MIEVTENPLSPEDLIRLIAPESSYDPEVDGFRKVIARMDTGEKVVYSTPRLLTIDIDSPDAMEEYKSRMRTIDDHIWFMREFSIPSPSGRGFHCYLLLDRYYTIPERLAMQALLGSDPMRETLSLSTYLKGKTLGTGRDFRTNPSWLFEKDLSLLPQWILDTQQDPPTEAAEGIVDKSLVAEVF